MGFEIDTEDWNQDEVEGGGGGNFLDGTTLGWGHFVVDSVEPPDDDDEKPFCDVVIKGLAPAAFRDKTRKIRFWLGGPGSRRFAILTVALGYKTKEAWNESRANKERVVIDFDALEGRQMCAKLVEEEYDKRDRNTGEKTGEKGKSCTIEWDMITVEAGQKQGYPTDEGEAEASGAVEFPSEPAENVDTGL